MKVLLRATETGMYVQGPDRWTNHLTAARDFCFLQRALNYVKTRKLRAVEVAFVWGDPPTLGTLPLAKARALRRKIASALKAHVEGVVTRGRAMSLVE